jgi:hypothetical protein
MKYIIVVLTFIMFPSLSYACEEDRVNPPPNTYTSPYTSYNQMVGVRTPPQVKDPESEKNDKK